ncbi:Peptidyl-prolyl cis-trans isomerase CWC27-like [Hondaea fermentalgiana]|uniref:Peptidyl-prolyl cis-trans isomerase CWC27-like n=1 Tax=Hondaea fermentalgiana TaxID=2315210 RepID=A0A2R5G1H2_9STRA|nr:Peptidyl-prolyl cis-trans isomerase CWC27-like [Hondaea fermentalgiana]|eukprot:GBG24375.1 Peptidyl-prolyl cis-trans isomerase CWC27-like [Hondaea fermentalgiana]
MEAPRIEEPPTAGRVVLKTSVGDLQVDLWSQQAPLACRNFVQLCMERYYEDVIFHRIVKKFMAQTGDPTGTGAGGASIFEDGKAFKDEIHQRLVFSRAGLLAMASKDEKRNSNQSQFFVTLGPCEWLNKQHTIFGKVTGDSIYNLHKFEAVEVDASGRPVAPEPRILSATVVDQPFPDIKPRKSRQEVEASKLRKQARKEEKRKKKARKHLDKKDTRLPKDEYESLRQELRGTSKDAQGKSTSASASMSAFEQRRAKYLQRRPAGAASQKSHQRNTLAKLQEFQAKLAKAGAHANGKSTSASNTNDTLKEEENYKGGIGENQMEDEGVQDANGHEWMHTELRFKRHIDDAFRSDKRGEKSHGRTDVHGKGNGIQTDDEHDDADELTIIDAKTAMGRAAFDQLEDERNRGPPHKRT